VNREKLDEATIKLMKYCTTRESDADSREWFLSVCHPKSAAVLRDVKGFIPICKYEYPEDGFEGEIGSIGNLRILLASYHREPEGDHHYVTSYLVSHQARIKGTRFERTFDIDVMSDIKVIAALAANQKE